MCTINGTVAPGYESVKELFVKNFRNGSDVNAQLCVYVGGERVVDLWGAAAPSYGPVDGYGPDTLQTVFSSTKSLAALLIACQVDRGLLDYDEKVATYWPDFAKNGKEDIKLCDVLRHEAGLVDFFERVSPKDCLTENIKGNAVGKIIEEETPRFPDKATGTTREYHGLTRGHVLNEVFRRVDPKGRTMGEYLREEISAPLDSDVFIGVEDGELGRFSKLIFPSMGGVFLQAMLPKFMGRKFEPSLSEVLNVMKMFAGSIKSEKPTTEGEKQPDFFELCQTDIYRKGQVPSANGSASARGLAKIASCMAQKGDKIMSKEAWEKMHDNVTVKVFAPLNWKLKAGFSQGGLARFKPCGPVSVGNGRLNVLTNELRDGYFGWYGMGGSVFQWHPDLEIGFAFVMNQMYWFDVNNAKAAYLQKEVARCAERIRAGKI